MDTYDFLEALSKPPTYEVKEAIQKLKTAAARDSVKRTLKEVVDWAKEHATKSKAWARENKHTLGGGAVGGVSGYVGTHRGHTKDKKTGLSPSQTVSRAAVQRAGKASKNDSYVKGVSRTVAKASKEYDDVASKHPRTAAATEALAIGVPAGAAAARFMFKRKHASALSIELADQWGRELAHEKTAFQAGRLGQTVGNIGKHVMKSDVGKRMAIGAAAGVAQDALTNNQSNAGSMATKAMGGALAGRYAKKGLKMLRTHDSDFGRGVAKGMKGWQNESK